MSELVLREGTEFWLKVKVKMGHVAQGDGTPLLIPDEYALLQSTPLRADWLEQDEIKGVDE